MSTQFVLQSAVNFPVALWIETPQWPFAYQGCTAGLCKLFLYSEDAADHRVDLYVQGSRSIPYQEPQNKWSHLNPQWRFTDVDGNTINDITLTNAVSTTFNNTTGYIASAAFRYFDDMPSHFCETIMIWAVADYSQYPVQKDNSIFPGYVNSKVYAVAPYLINELVPTSLEINRDGLNPMLDFYWINATIPHVVTVVGEAITIPEIDTRIDPCTAIMKNIPLTNVYGISGGSIVRTINSIPRSSLEWTPSNTSAFLSAIDYQDFAVGGYLKGKVISKETASSITLDASGRVFYESIPTHYPYLWVSNPENNSLNRIFAPCIKDEWMTYDAAPFLIELGQQATDMSSIQITTPVDVMALSGFHGIYGIAIDGEKKNIWCTDAESDKVYKFNPNGVLLSAFNYTQGSTPAGIALDGLSGAWVTFFDAVSVIRINTVNGNITTIIDPGEPFVGIPPIDSAFKPVLAEPDLNNDVWITYQNTICSALVKYSNTGSLISSITLPMCSNPMDIYITKENDIWVSLTKHAGPPYGISSILKYNGTTSNLMTSVPALNPAYLTMDDGGSIWFTQNNNTLTRVTSSGITTNWTVGAAASGVSSPAPSGITDSSLQGLCCDIYGKIWIVNSTDNSIYTIVNDNIRLAIKVMPDQNLSWYNNDGVISTHVNEQNNSAQAFGDWSGGRWLRKYGDLSVHILSADITGSSNTFNIYDYNGFDIRRFNESWDASNEIKKFARSPHIADNPVFWDKYMKAVWGDESSTQGTGFGREAYEKIANFVPNHVDVNVCNVDQLYSLAKYTDVPIDIYGVSLPAELKRLMDIGSINQQQLWGSRCKCSKNITNSYSTYLSGNTTIEQKSVCSVCGHLHTGNKGSLFDPTTYTVSAYIPFIVEDRTNNNYRYQLITPPNVTKCACDPSTIGCGIIADPYSPTLCDFIIDSLSPSVSTVYFNSSRLTDVCNNTNTNTQIVTSYPLSSFYNILLPPVFNYSISATPNEFQEAITHFCFYNYIPSYCTEQIAGVINWDDPYTTLQETASSTTEWYGSGQTLEKMINYVLHKGLGLIEV